MNVKFYPASRGIALSVCISVNGKYEYISLGENVFPNEIDRKNQCISTKCKRKEELRSLIDPVIDILESIRDYWEKNNIEFGAKDLKVEYNKRTKGTHGIDQSTLVKSAFEEKINQSLENGYLPVVVLSQESGEYRSLGKSALWAAEYAADKVNENGGVNGCKVQIISENTNSEKSKALSLFQGASRASFLVLGPMDAPETAYIAKNVERNQTINIAAYSFAESRNTMAPYGISYMSDSEAGDLEEVRVWSQANPDIKNVVLFTMSEDESQENTTELLQDRLEDMGLHLLKIVDIRQGASDKDYAYYAIQALNQGADGYIFLVRGKETGNILLKLRSHGVEEGRQISTSFSAYGSELFDVAGNMLDGISIWNKFDPVYQGKMIWQQLLQDYRIAQSWNGAGVESGGRLL